MYVCVYCVFWGFEVSLFGSGKYGFLCLSGKLRNEGGRGLLRMNLDNDYYFYVYVYVNIYEYIYK